MRPRAPRDAGKQKMDGPAWTRRHPKEQISSLTAHFSVSHLRRFGRDDDVLAIAYAPR
jgi:hypothetical protein